MSEFVDNLKNANNFATAITALILPLSSLLNILLIPQNKVAFTKLLFRFQDWTYVVLVVATFLLIWSIFFTFWRPKEETKTIVAGFNPAQQTGKRKKSKFGFFILSLILFVAASIFYLNRHLVVKAESGMFGFSFGQKGFDEKLSNLLAYSTKEKGIDFTYTDEKDSTLKSDDEYVSSLFKQYYTQGLYFTGKYTSSEGTQSVLTELRWIGEYDEMCSGNQVSSQLLLNGCKIHIDTSIAIINDFILGYWYLHDCEKLEEASNHFNNILSDTLLQNRIASLPAQHPLKSFRNTVKNLYTFSIERSSELNEIKDEQMRPSYLPLDTLLNFQSNQIFFKRWLSLPVWVSSPDVAVEYGMDTSTVYFFPPDGTPKETGRIILEGGRSEKETEAYATKTKVATDELEKFLKKNYPGKRFYRVDAP